MSVWSALLLASTWAYAGFQWTIRVLVYPQMRSVPADGFAAYEAEHQRRTSTTVGPLFAFLGVTALGAVVAEPGVLTAVVLVCFALVLATTALLAVPRHRQLTAGFDAAAHTALLRADTARLGLALLACAAAVAHAVG